MTRFAAGLCAALLFAAPAAAEPSGEDEGPKPAPAPAPAPPAGLLSGAKFWGTAFYQAVGADAPNSETQQWTAAQETGVSLNVRVNAGLEFLSDLAFPVDFTQNLSLRTVLQQLSVRVPVSPEVMLIAGKQRLNWGTAKIFSAIDTLEPRTNPIDVRSVLTGVSGVKAVVIPTDWLSFSLVALPAAELRWSGGAARADFVAEDLGLDLGFGVVKYTYDDKTFPAGDVSKRDRIALLSDGAWSYESLVLYEEMQLRWGRETGYQFPGMAGFNNYGGGHQAIFRGVGGAMLQLDLGLKRPALLVAEYLYNGDGLSTSEAIGFATDFGLWASSGAGSGSRIPGSFFGIGGFRQHYVALALQNIALQRYLLLGVNGILGLDSLFTRFGASLQWDPTQAVSISLRYELYHAFYADAEPLSELLLIPFRNRVALIFTASY